MNTARPRPRGAVVGTVAVILLLAASSCGSDDDSDSSSKATGEPAPTTVRNDGPTNETTAPAPDTAEFAEWQLIEVTDTGGETFTVADLVGRPVFVENFATWCSNCRRQLRDTQKAAKAAGDSAVFLALSVETELSALDVADYADDNGFTDIRFAVMSPELLAAMDAAFGTSALNPPSTPKVAVAADGRAGDLVTGPESSEEILGKLGIG